MGVAAAARLGRGPVARPPAARLGGHARGHHRGVGARAAAARARGARRRVTLPRLRRPALRRGARDRPGRAAAGQLPPDRARARRALTLAGDGRRALLVLGFEAVVEPRRAARCRALPRARRRGRARAAAAARAPGARRSCARPTCATRFVAMGVLSETFETAITWERLPALRGAGQGRGARGARRRRAASTCRVTHAYPDGAAPYFTVLAPARRGEEAEQWGAVKAAALGGDPRRRRHDHAPPRGRPRPPPVVRPPAAGAVRGRAARRQGGGRPARALNPGVLFDAR